MATWRKSLRILTEFYLVLYGEAACSLIPEGAVKEAICGTLGKVIKAAGSVVGTVADFVLGTIGDALDAIGITDLASDLWKGVTGFFTGKEDDCVRPDRYYADNYLICYNRAAFLKSTDPGGFDRLVGSLNDNCRLYYDRCFTSGHFNRLCNPLRDMFKMHMQTLEEALRVSASAYARSRRSSMEANRSRVCSPHYYESENATFVGGCENFLKDRFPLSGDASSDSCRPPTNGMRFGGGPSAQQAACQKLVDGELKRITAEVCLGAGMCFKIEGPAPETIVK